MDNKKWLILIGVLILLAGVTIFSLYNKKPTNKILPDSTPPSEPERPLDQQPPPSQIFDLTAWKLTLPITTPNDKSRPLEILQPNLATYQLDPWFKLTPDKKGIIFRAPVNAPTTANSTYPRSELREMTADGTEELFWPSNKGTHTLFLEEAITATPKNKPDVVAGQIHGDDDDLIVIRLEGQKLFLSRGKQNLFTLDENYTLGKRFTIKFVAQNGQIMTYYNQSETPVYVLEKKVKLAYFKVGVYTQSNCETEDSSNLCSTDNYGEVIIYQIKVTHE